MTAIFYFIYYFLIALSIFSSFCVNIKIFNRCRIFSSPLSCRAARPDEEVAALAYYGIRSCNTSASLNMLFVYNFFSFTSLCLLLFFFFFSPRSLLVPRNLIVKVFAFCLISFCDRITFIKCTFSREVKCLIGSNSEMCF